MSSWEGVTLIRTSVIGTLPQGIVGLIIGHSSNCKRNFEVLPGAIDGDSTGDIKVMIRPLKETVQIHKGQRIAQLLLLSYLKLPNPMLKANRGQGQFGSTDVVAWVQDIGAQRPFKMVRIKGRLLQGLLDTGADRTCLAGKDWPSAWSCQRTLSSFARIGNGLECSSELQPP